MLKRGGRGHFDNGIQNTKAGALAVLCPSCPHPGKNMPEGWEKCLSELSYVEDHLYYCSS